MSSQCPDQKSVYTVRRNKIENEQSLNREKIIKVISKIKNLHWMITTLFISENSQTNLTSNDDTLLNKSKISQINYLQICILDLETGIQKLIKKWQTMQQKIKNSFNSFQKQLQLFIQNEKYHKHLIQKLTKSLNSPLKLLNQHIEQFVIQDGEHEKEVNNEFSQLSCLEKENKELKQYLRKLQTKYKHVLFQQKSLKQQINSDQSNSAEYSYGMRRQGTDYPMRISVQILQRKVKQLQRQNMSLRKSQNLDCMSLIEELQRVIKALRRQKSSDFRTSRKLTQIGNQRANEEDNPYYIGQVKATYYQANRDKLHKNVQNSRQNYQTPSFQRVRLDHFQNNSVANIQRKRQKSVPTQLKPSVYF